MKLSTAAGFFAYILVALAFCIGVHWRDDARAAEPTKQVALNVGHDWPLYFNGHKVVSIGTDGGFFETPHGVATGFLAISADTSKSPLSLSADQKPITFKIDKSMTTAPVMWATPCNGDAGEVSFIVNDGEGHPIVSINECTGKVIIAHPERMDQQAREFWRTIQRAWPEVCAQRPTK